MFRTRKIDEKILGIEKLSVHSLNSLSLLRLLPAGQADLRAASSRGGCASFVAKVPQNPGHVRRRAQALGQGAGGPAPPIPPPGPDKSAPARTGGEVGRLGGQGRPEKV